MYTRSRSSTGGPGAGFGGGRGSMNTGNGNFQGQNPYNNHQGGNYQQSNYESGMMQQQPGNFQPTGPQTPNRRPGAIMQQQQTPKNRQPNLGQNQQNINQNQQAQQQQSTPPSAQKLKPILKQSAFPSPVAAAGQPPSTPTPVPPPVAAINTTANVSPAPAAISNPKSVAAPSAGAGPGVTTAAAAAAAAVPTAPTAPTAVATAPVATGVVKTSPVTTPTATPEKIAPTADDSAAKQAGDPQNDRKHESVEGVGSDDPRRWAEDDQSKWMDTDEQTGQWMDVEDGQQQVPKWRRFKKLSTNKPNKKLKRLRMNQRLRKTLMPKNAIMVLNEMKAGVQFTFPETQAIMPNSLFLVHAELEGKVYVGQGLSKPLARQNAAENALKCLLLEKMTAAAMKERVDTEGDSTAMETSDSQAEGGEQPPAKEGETAAEETATEESEDIPWSSLASFALYKLFLEWQNQGTVVPIPRPGVPPLPKNRADPKPPTEKVLPPNALEIHPVMLLNQMRPGTTYNEVGRVGNPPNIQFTLGVEINGQSYTGSAKNKKDAKKIAAKEALKALYNLEYPDETKTDAVEVAQ